MSQWIAVFFIKNNLNTPEAQKGEFTARKYKLRNFGLLTARDWRCTEESVSTYGFFKVRPQEGGETRSAKSQGIVKDAAGMEGAKFSFGLWDRTCHETSKNTFRDGQWRPRLGVCG